MFNKLKQFKDLRNQAKTLRDMLADETISAERDGIKLVLNGNQEVVSFTVPETIDKQRLEAAVPALFNDATKKIHRIIAEKMQASGMNLPGM